MADKKIIDFITLADAKDDDLILVASEGETYTMKVKTVKEAVQGDADRAEAAVQAVKEMAENVKSAADEAISNSNAATQSALEAAGSAQSAVQAAVEAAASANTAAENAQTAAEQAISGAEERVGTAVAQSAQATAAANTAAREANASKASADAAAQAANMAAQEADTAAQNAAAAAAEADAAKENAQNQANYAKEQGDRAMTLTDKLEGTDVGGMAADILDLQTTKADMEAIAEAINRHNADLAAHEVKRRVIEIRERDPGKPSYEEDAEVEMALDAGPYTGEAAIGVVLNGDEYDANNLSKQGDTAANGTLLIKELEE